MRTQLQMALDGRITREMRTVSKDENVDAGYVRGAVADGSIVIPKNMRRQLPKAIGIGKGLRTKVNANIGTSPDSAIMKEELKKLRAAMDAGTDTVMDLSIGGDLRKIRRSIIAGCDVPMGTVPIYQAAVESARDRHGIVGMDAEKLFDSIEEQAMDGVDFMTVHCGVTMRSLRKLKETGWH